MSEEKDNTVATEGPTGGQSAPAGGHDPHREAARKAEEEGGTPDGTAQGEAAGGRGPVTHRENAETTTTTSGEGEESTDDQGGDAGDDQGGDDANAGDGEGGEDSEGGDSESQA